MMSNNEKLTIRPTLRQAQKGEEGVVREARGKKGRRTQEKEEEN